MLKWYLPPVELFLLSITFVANEVQFCQQFKVVDLIIIMILHFNEVGSRLIFRNIHQPIMLSRVWQELDADIQLCNVLLKWYFSWNIHSKASTTDLRNFLVDDKVNLLFIKKSSHSVLQACNISMVMNVQLLYDLHLLYWGFPRCRQCTNISNNENFGLCSKSLFSSLTKC